MPVEIQWSLNLTEKNCHCNLRNYSNLLSLEETSYLILEIAIWRLCWVTSIQNLSGIIASLELQVHPRLNKAMVPTPLLDK